MPLKNLFSLTEPFGPPSPLAPLSETRTTIVLSSSPGLLEEVEQPPDLVVGVAEEPGVHLGHAGEQPLLVVGQRVPRPHDVERRPGLAVDALLLRVRVERRQLGVVGKDPHLLLALEDELAVLLVAHVELALVLLDPLLRGVVRGVASRRGRST